MRLLGVQTCALDRKSTRLNSSHTIISYAVFCLKKTKLHATRSELMRLGHVGDAYMGRPASARVWPVVCSPTRPSVSSPPPSAPCRFFFLRMRPPPASTLFPHTTLFR